MRITIVNGFFLPVPAVSGGSTEKAWHRLAREFAARGHEVVSISRRWPGFPDDETIDGVRHLRLPGFTHHHSLVRNLILDFRWCLRVHRALPPADIVVCNVVALPVWLGRIRPRAGKVVVVCGRLPKGQYRHYARIARVIAASEFVAESVVAENPALASVVRTTGYPMDWSLFSQPGPTPPAAVVPPAAANELTLGFVGRIHEEKGLMLLADALRLVNATPGLPRWRLLLCGPTDVARGGSGPEFRERLLQKLSAAIGTGRFHLLEPQFDDHVLAGVYRSMDIFCYPSLATKGETFGVAVAEAMAAGAVPVVSNLACFQAFLHDDENGLVFDHAAADAPARLAGQIVRLLGDAGLRQRLAPAARAATRPYDFPRFAEYLLDDFAGLIGG
ncbi:MAG: hypothetical protein JWQ83_529 [Lacunisphaera sp.]|nr:hypothetical protein [Lacunisphaera sp.]MDB6165389.1 hypothetical protein [Lacunisphaera sp.]